MIAVLSLSINYSHILVSLKVGFTDNQSQIYQNQFCQKVFVYNIEMS